MQKDKVRIFALARELGWESKDLLTLCRQHGIDVKNQLSTLEPEVRDKVVQLVQKGGGAGPGAPSTARPALDKIAEPQRPIRNLDTRRPRPTSGPARPQPEVAQTPPSIPATPPSPPPAASLPESSPPAVPPVAPPAPPPPAAAPPTLPPAQARAPEQPVTPRPPEPPPAARPPEPPVVSKGPETPSPAPPRVPEQAAPPAPPRPAEQPAAARPPEPPPPPPVPEQPAARPPSAPVPPAVPRTPAPPPAPTGGSERPAGGSERPGGLPHHGGPRPIRDLNRPRPGGGQRGPSNRPRPGGEGTFRIAPPPPLKKPAVKPPDEKKGPAPAGPRKIAEIPPELMGQGGQVRIEDILRPKQTPPPTPGKPAPAEEIPEGDEEGGDRRGGAGKGHKPRPGAVAGRGDRHKERNARQAARKGSGEVDLKGGRVGLLEEDERAARIRRVKLKQKAQKGPQPRKGKVPIEVPITVRSLSEAIGVKSGELLMKLMGHGLKGLNINSTLEADLAETIALEQGCELDVKRRHDAEEELVAGARKPDNPEDLVLRAPIVTVMGHVDHGKTSLLDRIRRSNVAATETGGITQVIRAWRVEHGGRPITFLDTPGHEAFTKMRARGAQVTDIAVIVVAADDGVMPQTEEAINHAKAAGVSIVVAINKVDLPNANIKRTEQQLYGLGLIPDTMGGDVPFVQTSAATGKGIDELLDILSLVAELKELTANPNKPASGTCLEAYKNEEEGVLATILVQDGTLNRGDVVLCGATYGRVRAMYDDLGRPIQEAGPTVPVRITGLDDVPNADDPFLVVPDLAVAREIAEKRKEKQHGEALHHRPPVSLESLSEIKVAELKVILKAEARGSIEAIRAELEKLKHEEVRVRLLHAAIGGINVSDVQLALTSPQDTLIVGFNVVPDDEARKLAEERGISIREYAIIYQLADDIRAALEGKLKPREEVIHLGRAVVRQTFKISRVGTIAGCYVTQGVIERSAKVRVIRGGAVVYPPADRTVGLESLKRFKEDVREVREGFECGLKVAGYDDLKVDDVIEAYRIEQVQRTLS